MQVAKRLNNRERTALVFCTAFLLATMLLASVDQRSVIHSARMIIDPNYDQVRYTGTIVVPAKPSGQCRFTEFDNKTIEFRRTEIAECLARRGVYSPFDRMNSLRDAFNR